MDTTEIFGKKLDAYRRRITEAPFATILVILSVAIFTIHYLIFFGYIVDDAGITFGAAKTIVEFGRFSIDRYAEIVESYSNPSWMAILAFVHLLGFDIILAAKFLGWVFGVLTLFLVYHVSSRYGSQSKRCAWANALGPLLLSISTGFVLWGAAGLENHLFGLSIVGLVLGIMIYEKETKILPITAFALLVATTRPEGVIFSGLIYLVLLLRSTFTTKLIEPKLVKSIIMFTIFFGTFLLSRLWIYSWPLPNTYYAKIGSSLIYSIASGSSYLLSYLSSYFSLIVMLIFLILVYSIATRRDFLKDKSFEIIRKILLPSIVSISLIFLSSSTAYLVLGNSLLNLLNIEIVNVGKAEFLAKALLFFAIVLLSIGTAIVLRKDLIEDVSYHIVSIIKLVFSNRLIFYSLLIVLVNVIYILRSGGTWGTTRFLTPTVVTVSLIFVELLKENLNQLSVNRSRIFTPSRIHFAVGIMLVFFVLQCSINSYSSLQNPIVPFSGVKQGHADFGNEAGGYLLENEYFLSPKQISYMVPDLGATSYYAENYTIIDSARLGNVPFAHNQYEEQFFKHYVFEVVDPVLIETHVGWSYATKITNYSEFNDRYSLVKGVGNKTYSNYGSTPLANGYYIREDVFSRPISRDINSSDPLSPLRSCKINNTIFSSNGNMDLHTYWTKTGIFPSTDEYQIKFILANSSCIYILDNRPLLGGFYRPSQWKNSTEVFDKRIINLQTVQPGDYSLLVSITSLNSIIDDILLANVSIISDYHEQLHTYKDAFHSTLLQGNFSDAYTSLSAIRALDEAVHACLFSQYVYTLASHVNETTEQNIDDSFNLIHPFVGVSTGNLSTDNQLRRTEYELSRRFEERGAVQEKQGLISAAIWDYEMAIWLNPDKAHLRHHLEDIRPKQHEDSY